MSDDRRAEAAEALRRFGHALMSREADDELLRRVTEAAHRVADDLERAPARERDLLELKRRMFDVEIGEGEAVSHFDECFVSGSQNPLGIGATVRREGEDVVASVELGPAYEGAPGRSHGGIVAAIFDDVLGYLLTLEQQPGFTGELAVRYLAPVPLGQPLEFRSRVVGREGRKLFAEGEAYADGDVVARATATFVTISLDRIRA
ncbi:MAG: PaaI family thioesterase [Nitriliruptorales bacterium]